MKKGKSRHKRKKSRLLWIAIAVIGMAAVISKLCELQCACHKLGQQQCRGHSDALYV